MNLLIAVMFFAGVAILPTYECSKTETGIAIDGIFNDKPWLQARSVMLKDNCSGKIPVNSTVVKMCCDEKFLYVAFECKDDSISAGMEKHDDDLFLENEVVELFIDQDNDKSSYFEFQINPNNAKFDALVFRKDCPSGNYLLKSFNPESFKSAVKHTVSGWNVEMKISWIDLGHSGKPASVLNINLYRLNKSGSVVEHSAWSPTDGSSHQPDKFGKLIITAERSGIRYYVSNIWHGDSDSVFALSDGKYTEQPEQEQIPRFTWWPRQGSTEWVELHFDRPRKISELFLYWFDDSAHGGNCKIPEHWEVEYHDHSGWHFLTSGKPFASRIVDAIKLKAKLCPGFSAGLYEIKFK